MIPVWSGKDDEGLEAAVGGGGRALVDGGRSSVTVSRSGHETRGNTDYYRSMWYRGRVWRSYASDLDVTNHLGIQAILL